MDLPKCLVYQKTSRMLQHKELDLKLSKSLSKIHRSHLANSKPSAFTFSQPRNVGLNSYSSLNVQENAEMIKGTAKALSKQTLPVTLATRGGTTRHS